MNLTGYKGRPKSKDVDRVIGRNIKLLRDFKKISLVKLGEFVGVTFQQIQKYERGRDRVSAANLMKMSEALGVSMEDFFIDQGE